MPINSTQPAVAVHLVVHNGARWLRRILDPLMAQTYSNVRILLIDNCSDDGTGDIVLHEYPSIQYIRKEENRGIWAMQEDLLDRDDAPYVLVLTDVIMDPSFIERGVSALQQHPDAGAIQAKILQVNTRADGSIERTDIIDTVGFRISRGLHITNDGHGETDTGQYDDMVEVFGVEGAAPLFRRSALEDIRIDGALVDPDYRVDGIGYGDDVDIAWRMRLFGFRHLFVPRMIGWHDRSTTKTLATSAILGRLSRISTRRAIPLAKRRLDWSNIRFTIIKNAFSGTLIRNAPHMITREIATIGYMALFEPGVLREVRRLIRLIPTMIGRRRIIMSKARITSHDMRQWLT